MTINSILSFISLLRSRFPNERIDSLALVSPSKHTCKCIPFHRAVHTSFEVYYRRQRMFASINKLLLNT